MEHRAIWSKRSASRRGQLAWLGFYCSTLSAPQGGGLRSRRPLAHGPLHMVVDPCLGNVHAVYVSHSLQQKKGLGL